MIVIMVFRASLRRAEDSGGLGPALDLRSGLGLKCLVPTPKRVFPILVEHPRPDGAGFPDRALEETTRNGILR